MYTDHWVFSDRFREKVRHFRLAKFFRLSNFLVKIFGNPVIAKGLIDKKKILSRSPSILTSRDQKFKKLKLIELNFVFNLIKKNS